MREELKNQIKEYGDAGPYIIKAKAEELNLPENWDKIPDEPKGKYVATSVISYRNGDIWLFKYDPRWGIGEEYDMVHFKDYIKYPELEDMVWSIIETEGGIKRLPDDIYLN